MGPEYNFLILLKNVPVWYVLIAPPIVLSFVFEMVCAIFVQLNFSLAFNIELIKFVTNMRDHSIMLYRWYVGLVTYLQ